MNNVMIDVFVNGRLRRWPLIEYLDYKASQYGFDDYDDMRRHGYHLHIEPKELIEEVTDDEHCC